MSNKAHQRRKHVKWWRYMTHNIKLSENTVATRGMMRDYDWETREFYRKWPNGKPIQ